MPHVYSVSVTLTTESARITHSGKTSARDLIEKVCDIGFGAKLALGESAQQTIMRMEKKEEIQEWKQYFLYCLIFAVPEMLVSMVIPYIPFLAPFFSWNVIGYLSFSTLLECLLAIPVQFGLTGRQFYSSAWKSVRHGAANMDVLITIGTTCAFGYSFVMLIYEIFNPDDADMMGNHENHKPSMSMTFFETGVMLITFIALGRYLENVAKSNSSAALSGLMLLQPTTATLIDPETLVETNIQAEVIQVGDTIKIIGGAKIPADGVVIYGSAAINESMLTGESLPVVRKVDDQVIAGSLNVQGVIHIRATRTGTDTALAHIVQLVEEAQTAKAPIEAFADQIASIFVPAVIAVSMITFLVWIIVLYINEDRWPFFRALKYAISTIVAACPCALGLATPTAVMVGTGVGAKNGILIKGGAALERGSKIDTVVFDKTGSLTEGKMSVIKCHHIQGDAASYLHVIGHTEASSEHPIAKSIVDYVKSKTAWKDATELSKFETVLGQGVTGVVDGQIVVVGNESYMLQQGIRFGPIAVLEGEQEQGRTIVYAGVAGEGVCAFIIGDQLKKSAKRTVRYLQKRNITVAMASGDNQVTCQAIGNELGIAVVYAGILPEGKAKLIKQLQKNKQRVAFVGDGVNDSPALVVADLGIAFGEGTEIAMEAADIVLMRDNLFDVVAALNLSTTIFRRIKLNFVWASIYNLTGVPLAAGVFSNWGVTLHPMVAGGMMALSSVSVVTSSLQLRSWKRPSENISLFNRMRFRIASLSPFKVVYNRLRHHGSDLEMV